MKPAITITTTILACGLAAGLASAQRPSVIQNTRATMNGVTSQQTAASNAALSPRTAAPPAANATRPPLKQHTVATTAKTPAKTTSLSPAGAHLADARAKHHLRRRWVNGVLVEEAVPGPAEGSRPEALQVEASASGDVTTAPAGEVAANEQSVTPDRKYTANGRRDPFISPVVSHAGGSGCSTGKKCLEIGAINLRGVVHSDGGFIAVVSNGLNKAYFLRENDPVFNGYVMKITGDSIVFQETVQDRLGKTFTREVVKKITTPAV